MTKNLPTPRRGPPPGMPALAVPLGALAACEPTLQRDDLQGVWLGLGLMGLVGWSVAVPTLLGAALGLWLDQQYPGARLWTVALMVVGLGWAARTPGTGSQGKTWRCARGSMTAMTDSSRGLMAGPGALLRSATHHERAEKQPPVLHGADPLAHTAPDESQRPPDAAPVCTRISIRLMNGTTREEAWAIAGALRACFDGACHLKASMDKAR